MLEPEELLELEYTGAMGWVQLDPLESLIIQEAMKEKVETVGEFAPIEAVGSQFVVEGVESILLFWKFELAVLIQLTESNVCFGLEGKLATT